MVAVLAAARTVLSVLAGAALGGAVGYSLPFLICYGVANEFVAQHPEYPEGQLIVPNMGVAPALFYGIFFGGVLLGGALGLVLGVRANWKKSSR